MTSTTMTSTISTTSTLHHRATTAAFAAAVAVLLGAATASPAAAAESHGRGSGSDASSTHSNNSPTPATDTTGATSNDHGRPDGTGPGAQGTGSSTPTSHQSTAQQGAATSPQPPSTADDSGHGANVPGPYDSTRDGSPSANGNGDGAARGKPCAGCVGRADNKNPRGQQPGGSDHNAGHECDRNAGVGRGNPAHTGCTEAAATTGSPGTTPGGGKPGTTPGGGKPGTTPGGPSSGAMPPVGTIPAAPPAGTVPGVGATAAGSVPAAPPVVPDSDCPASAGASSAGMAAGCPAIVAPDRGADSVATKVLGASVTRTTPSAEVPGAVRVNAHRAVVPPVLGVTMARPGSGATTPSPVTRATAASLPFTGADTAGLLAAGLVLVLVGGGAVIVGRRAGRVA